MVKMMRFRFLLFLLLADIVMGFFTIKGTWAPPTSAYFYLFFTKDATGKEFLMIAILPYMVTSLAIAYILSNVF